MASTSVRLRTKIVERENSRWGITERKIYRTLINECAIHILTRNVTFKDSIANSPPGLIAKPPAFWNYAHIYVVRGIPRETLLADERLLELEVLDWRCRPTKNSPWLDLIPSNCCSWGG